jgi:hypothetical protein
LLVDHAGNPKLLLERGQIKNIVTDRIILVPGPLPEIRTVNRIFRWFVNGMSEREIASKLNRKQLLTHLGRPWTRNAILEKREIHRSERLEPGFDEAQIEASCK